MTIGYDKPLYIMPFDHRGSFAEKLFGWAGALTADQTAQIAAAKQIIYAGFQEAVRGGVPEDKAGILVDEQFGAWQLTPTEREVAMLLLKGHGHKQIAAATGRSERTVRQHAVAVYQKSGLQGRAELAAFFLEDLVVPAPLGPPRGQSKTPPARGRQGSP